MCFPVNFAKLLRTNFYIEHLLWLLLQLTEAPVDVLPHTCSENFHKIHREIDAIESVSQNNFFIVNRQGELPLNEDTGTTLNTYSLYCSSVFIKNFTQSSNNANLSVLLALKITFYYEAYELI